MKPRWKFGDYVSALLVLSNALGFILYAAGIREPTRFSAMCLSLIAAFFFLQMLLDSRLEAYRALRAQHVKRLLREADAHRRTP